MTAYMKQTVQYGGTGHHGRPLSIFTVLRSITKGRNHVSLYEKEAGSVSMELPFEVEEKIRQFRQKHFKD